MTGWPFAPFTAPSQSPVPRERLDIRYGTETVIEGVNLPVGFFPAEKPSWGARVSICEAVDGALGAGDGAGDAGAGTVLGAGEAGEDVAGGDGLVPALIAAA